MLIFLSVSEVLPLSRGVHLRSWSETNPGLCLVTLTAD